MVMRRILLLFLSLAGVILFAGCGVGYVFHAAVGEMRLLSNAVPVDQALESDSLNRPQKDRLLLVSQIKEFGEKELGLKKTSNYETIYLGSDQPPLYTIAAAPKDSLALLTWWFPFVGRMPYLGFFDLKEAQEEKQSLLHKNLDVVIGRAEAFSTLGWFKDPLTLNLIDGSELALAQVILHEMTHTTFYVKGQGEFNEGLAQIVGKKGALLFFEKTCGPSHPLTVEARASVEDERLFSLYLVSVLTELDRLYRSPLSFDEKLREREKVFQRQLEEFNALKSRLKTTQFVHFGRVPLNNAYLMAVSLYHRNYPLFEAVLDTKGNSVREMLAFFQDLDKQDGNLLEATRNWLKNNQADHRRQIERSEARVVSDPSEGRQGTISSHR
jgi:predicted aminopeptidase